MPDDKPRRPKKGKGSLSQESLILLKERDEELASEEWGRQLGMLRCDRCGGWAKRLTILSTGNQQAICNKCLSSALQGTALAWLLFQGGKLLSNWLKKPR